MRLGYKKNIKSQEGEKILLTNYELLLYYNIKGGNMASCGMAKKKKITKKATKKIKKRKK
jgi:hypothetical protein